MPSSGPSRLSTTDLAGPVLIFLGGFLLATAIALPTVFVDTLRTIPLSTDVTVVAQSDPGARILDRCSLNAPTAAVVGAQLTRQQRFVAVQPSDTDRVTLQAGTSIRADHLVIDGRQADTDTARPGSDAHVPNGATSCTDATLTALRDRITLNRTSALPDLTSGGHQPGSSEIQYDKDSAPVRAPDRSGYTYLMPFGVSTSGQRFFDVTTRRSVPLHHAGDTTVHGHDATVFTADVPDTDLHQIGSGNDAGTPPTMITRPAGWFGLPGVDPTRSVTATLHHSSRWELDVDPATGVILNEKIGVDETYRLIDTSLPDHRLTNMSATFSYDQATQRAQGRRATALASPLVVWGRVLPILGAILGVAAVVAGLAILNPAWRPRPLRQRPGPAPSTGHDEDPPASS